MHQQACVAHNPPTDMRAAYAPACAPKYARIGGALLLCRFATTLGANIPMSNIKAILALTEAIVCEGATWQVTVVREAA